MSYKFLSENRYLDRLNGWMTRRAILHKQKPNVWMTHRGILHKQKHNGWMTHRGHCETNKCETIWSDASRMTNSSLSQVRVARSGGEMKQTFLKSNCFAIVSCPKCAMTWFCVSYEKNPVRFQYFKSYGRLYQHMCVHLRFFHLLWNRPMSNKF